MVPAFEDAAFVVWGADRTAYGPVDLPTLVSWVKDERVTADTWVFATHLDAWEKAGHVAELQMFFRPKTPKAPGIGSQLSLNAGMLRRIRILAGLTEPQLEKFATYAELQKVPQWSLMVKQGDAGDAMYLILEGELRVRLNVAGKETILATLGPGEFFGDISLFDHGPRSADVVANVDSVVIKITAKAFDELAQDYPDLATPFLLAIGRTLTARIRADNKRWGDSVRMARTL